MSYRTQLAFEAFGHQSLFGRLESRLDRIKHERTLPLEGFADCTIGGPAIEHAMEYRRQLYADMGLKFI